MMKRPAVSVVVPNYNGEKHIIEALSSVRNQTFYDFEVIVADDCSIDRSPELVRGFIASDPRFSLIRLTVNAGAAACRNAAIRGSRGRYLAFLDGDDLWRPEKLEVQLAAMRRTSAPMSCTAVNVIDCNGRELGERRVPGIISYSTLLRRTPVVTSSVIVDTEALGRLEMPSILRRQDLAMWLKVIRLGGSALGVDTILGSYRVHSGSLSRNKWVAAHYTWKVIREIENLPLHQALYYFSFYALGGIMGRLRGLN